MPRKPCKNHPERAAHARSMCQQCYKKWYDENLGKVVEDGPRNQIHASASHHPELGKREDGRFEKDLPADLPVEFRQEMANLKGSEVKPLERVKRSMSAFLFSPQRVGRVLDRFYSRALTNDKVLLDYVRVLLPRQDANPPVQVTINTALLQPTNKTYNIEGEVVPTDGEKNETTV